MAKTRNRLSRPRSVLFDTVKTNSMKRMTAFLGRPDDSENEMDTFGQLPRGPESESLAPPGDVTPIGTRPHLSVSTPSLAMRSEDQPPMPGAFAPPRPPFAGGPQRPSSPGSLSVPSRPQSAGGLGVPGSTKSAPELPIPDEFPRLKRKKQKSGGLFGKKKHEDIQMAWRWQQGSTEALEAYDVGPLLRGEQVKELWYPDGDTLVYFCERDDKNSKYSKPVFRIHSSPLMFSGLGDKVEDTHPLDLPDQSGENGPAADGLFFSVPTVNTESGEAERQAASSNSSSNEGERTGSPDEAQAQGEDQQPSQEVAQQQENQDTEGEAGIMYKVWFPVMELSAPPSDGGKKKGHKLSKSEAENTLQRFIDARNLFGFLDRTYLVATQTRSQSWEVFIKIFKQLQLSTSDTDMNASSKMFMAESHLQTYMDEVGLDDVRNDDDKILEALALAERWRSARLYHEAFLHAVGRWEGIRHHPGWDLIMQSTKSRIDRASIDLVNLRLMNIHQRIPNFEFPSVWLGAGKYAKYSGWRNGYDRMRSFTMSYYKHYYGSWPPKAGKKGKGGGYTETGGLNRLVLRRIYEDLCGVYDLVVDRNWIHGEQLRPQPEKGGSDGEKSDGADPEEEARKTLRTIEEEFNTAYMPVVPGIPFDVPRIPSATPGGSKKKSKGFFKSGNSVSSDEMTRILNASYNQDSLEEYGKTNQFVSQFIQMEKEWGTGKKVEDSAEARRGRWIFMYCVLQSLPMTAVDGAGLRHGDGVEYFLCENVKGAAPWERGRNNRQSRMSMWVPGGQDFGSSMSLSGMMGNPDDEIDNIFRRSHCWEAAESWRLVEAEEGEDYYEEFDQYGYGSMDGSGFLPEQQYQPDQQIPMSPTVRPQENGSPEGQFAAYQDPGAPEDEQVNDSQPQSGYSSRETSQSFEQQLSGPAWAQEARQSYYAQPRYSPAPSSPYDPHNSGASGHERSVSTMSRQSYQSGRGSQPSRSSSLPTSPVEHTPEQHPQALPPVSELQPLQLQPFEFDLKPLEITKTESPVQSPVTQSPRVSSPTMAHAMGENPMFATHRDIDSAPIHGPQSPPQSPQRNQKSYDERSPEGSPRPAKRHDIASPTFGKERIVPEEGQAF